MLVKKYPKDDCFYQVLGLDGQTKPGYVVPLSNDVILDCFYTMLLSRRMDQRLLKYQRQGRMLTFPPNLGEEALQVGTSLNIHQGDWFVPAFRSGTVFLHQKVPMLNIFLVWRGNELGNKMPADKNILPFNVPIGTQFSHAGGIGLALNYQQKPNVAFTFIGDGGTAEGEFYEALNLASIRGSQTVFCINNNKWAISTPTKYESGQSNLAVKAIAAGMAWIRVDGNDLFASYEAAKEAREYVLSEKKPILVEFITYRMGPHTTSDNPRVYRSEAYEKEEEKRDPILRLQLWLEKHNLLPETLKAEYEAKIEAEINQTYEEMQKHLKVSVDEVFDYTYATLDPDLAEQKAEALKLHGGK